MWKRSFVAITVALGGSVDDALAALGAAGDAPALADLAARLRAPQRATRAAALAAAVRDVAARIDEVELR